MKNSFDSYGVYEDDAGESYFCPLDLLDQNRTVSGNDLDNCVEASTVGRYSGNLNVVDRFDA